MKDLLTEIGNVLSEEMTISNVVVSATKELMAAIIRDSKKYEWENSAKKGNFDTYVRAFANNKVSVSYHIFGVKSILDYKPVEFCWAKEREDGTFELFAILVYTEDSKRYIDYKGLMQHEVEHLYQMIMSPKTLITNKASYEMYQTATSLLHSTDRFEKLVGMVVYYNNNFERDAYANSVYRDIMNNSNQSAFLTLQKNQHYQNINRIKEVMLDTNDFDEQLTHAVETKFGKSLNWLKRTARSVVKTYINKFGKAMAKAQKDMYDGNQVLDGGIFGNMLFSAN